MTHKSFKLPKVADLFDSLPDDLVIAVLRHLSASASSPADLFSLSITCKRLNRLVMHPLVLSQAGPTTLSVKPKTWSRPAHRFLFRCAAAGSTEASYVLGMIRFYCLKSRNSGLSLMAKAAMKSHAPSLYALAVIQFNGSGGATKAEKNLQGGVALAHRAAFLGHVHALRELGHCLQDGFGVLRNVAEGRRLLFQANARECNNAPPEFHPVHRFLREWFDSGRGENEPGLRICSHGGCGRPETRVHEFRRCSVCGKVNYCSRGCQALDWKVRHKEECVAEDGGPVVVGPMYVGVG